jgi:hypothetical protein
MSGARYLRWIASAMAAGAAALVLAGCGEPPTAPAPPEPGSASGSPSVLFVGADGSFSYVDATTDALLAGSRGGSAPSRSLTTTAKVDGGVGGKLSCGRFVVTVPPGAFSGTGTVSMTLADSALAVVDLSISPNALNRFAVPVQLSYDPRGLALVSPVTIFWLDHTKWVGLPTRPQLGTGFPTADLQHFSKYSAGKAGW